MKPFPGAAVGLDAGHSLWQPGPLAAADATARETARLPMLPATLPPSGGAGAGTQPTSGGAGAGAQPVAAGGVGMTRPQRSGLMAQALDRAGEVDAPSLVAYNAVREAVSAATEACLSLIGTDLSDEAIVERMAIAALGPSGPCDARRAVADAIRGPAVALAAPAQMSAPPAPPAATPSVGGPAAAPPVDGPAGREAARHSERGSKRPRARWASGGQRLVP